MKDLSIYFSPLVQETNFPADTIGSLIESNNQHGFPQLDKSGVALIYVPEFRNGQPATERTHQSFVAKWFLFASGRRVIPLGRRLHHLEARRRPIRAGLGNVRIASFMVVS